MSEIACALECGHQIKWGEAPEMPGAALPHVGQDVYCQECGDDTEIVACNPSQIYTDRVDLSQYDQSDCYNTRAVVFYDCTTGTWGYCLSSEQDGLLGEGEDVTGYESEAAARRAAITAGRDEYRRGLDDDDDDSDDDGEVL